MVNTFDDLVQLRYKWVKKHASRNYASLHEGFAFLKEEVDELWNETRKRTENRIAVLGELVDICVVVKRIEDCLHCFMEAEDKKAINELSGKVITP